MLKKVFHKLFKKESITQFAIKVEKIQRIKTINERCNISTLSFENNDKKFFQIICDGKHSEPCTVFISNKLKTGSMSNEMFDMLNEFMLKKCKENDTECRVAVDVLEIDLATHTARFFKRGSAPTLIYRNRTIYNISTPTQQIGSSEQTDRKEVEFDLLPGDVLLMANHMIADKLVECWVTIDEKDIRSDLTADRLLESSIDPEWTGDVLLEIIQIAKAE